jgi:hypothetical protein
MCAKCRFVFRDLSAVCFVYRYVIQLKARFQMMSPKLPKPARQVSKPRLEVLNKS